ncbi:NADH dehydrogenase FAD-containing subunit [Haloactinospora alba]|uniref:NADH dehydrogenase FAD-containing subunit n=1 Tax=Haloactinospora alba TaxID=405555 RepID=A0A543NML9_9ACTN|nr:FAD-dependent oxidoreductase [Haloactinospora alba]TQN33082.1 NADH dehydrogenase FAD-containing subunit [Haloactinospora alba]
MTATVVVVGGGYGGITAARALDDVADVVLVDPRDTFVHNVAALRGLADPAWTDRIFLSYDRLLDRGRVVHEGVVRADAAGVTLASGERIDADYMILATGSTYPFPAKVGTDDSTAARARIRATREALSGAGSVLLLGGGPVGLELAGEIKAVWADKTVTVVDPAEDIVSGDLPAEFRAELRRQLGELGVELLVGTSLREGPPSEAGEAETFTATTHSGREVTADIWFRCFGAAPNSDYVAGDLAAARRPTGHVDVTAELRLPGHDHVFAVGDLTAIAESKKAKAAEQHAAVAAANIRTLILGGDRLDTYDPAPPSIVLPLGPTGGASYTPDTGVLGAETTSRLKGTHMRLGPYTELLRTE